MTTYGTMTSMTHRICEISSRGGGNDRANKARIMLACIVQMIISGQSVVMALGHNTELKIWGEETEDNLDPEEESKRNVYYDMILRPKELGNYSLNVEAHEVPYYETLPIVVKEYFTKTIARYLVEVDNMRPSARYDMQTIKRVDIWYNNSHYNKSALFRQKLDAMVSQLRSENNLDIQFNQVDTYEDKKTIEKYKVKYIETVGSGDMGVTGSESEVAKKYLSGTFQMMTVKIPSMRADNLDAVRIGINMFHSVELDENGRWKIKYPENINNYTGFTGWSVSVQGETGGLIGKYTNKSMSSDSSVIQVEFYTKGTDELMTVKIGGASYENLAIQDLFITCGNEKDGETPEGQLGAGLQATVGTWKEEERERITIVQVPTILATALSQMNWRTDALKFVIYANHDEAKAYKEGLEDNLDFNKEVQLLTQCGAYYIGVCSSKNKDDFNRAYNILNNIKPEDEACALYTNAESSIDDSISSIKNYILSKVPNSEQNKKWILLDSEVSWSTTYDDYEGDVPLNVLEHDTDKEFISKHNISITSKYTDDKILAEKWRFKHHKEIYDNDMGLISTSDLWVVNPITTFNKVGLYRINYKRKDNPLYSDVNKTNAFDNYRYWSTDYDSEVEKAS